MRSSEGVVGLIMRWSTDIGEMGTLLADVLFTHWRMCVSTIFTATKIRIYAYKHLSITNNRPNPYANVYC
jgi:hypothetical protein